MRPDPDEVRRWLAAIPDPELPFVSLVDLGIVRAVEWQDGTCVVTITPTYSGCPAMAVIADAIKESLHNHDIASHRVVTRLAPAWTTDWILPEARHKLKDAGIAPPGKVIDISGLQSRSSAPSVSCPRCDSPRTRLISQFGSTPCKALYRCVDCLEPFDHFKPH